jgi:putative DNA primase/helicase
MAMIDAMGLFNAELAKSGSQDPPETETAAPGGGAPDTAVRMLGRSHVDNSGQPIVEQGAPALDVDLIRRHVETLHGVATAGGVSGFFRVMADFAMPDADPAKPWIGSKKGGPQFDWFAVGAVEAMTDWIASMASFEWNNVYLTPAVFREDDGSAEADIVAVLGLVADFDDADAARWHDRMPVAADYALETSPGRYQVGLLFDRPVPPQEAKRLAVGLADASGCDGATKRLQQPFRVAGTVNWPTEGKVRRGRPPVPFAVRTVVEDGFDDGGNAGSRTPPEALATALPPARVGDAPTPPVAASGGADRVDGEAVIERLKARNLGYIVDKIERPPAEGERRHGRLHNLVGEMKKHGFVQAEIAAAIAARPGGAPGEKWVTDWRGDWSALVRQIEACWSKVDDGRTLDDEAVAELLGGVGAGGGGADDDGLILTKASDIECRPTSWLWHGWLAMGKFHLLGGQPGAGKTTVAVDLAAIVSSGRSWPDGSHGPDPGVVLMWSGEDAADDVLGPRLRTAGADMDRVHFIGGRREGGEARPFDPKRDMGALAKALRATGAKLLILDPVVAFVTGDDHKNNEVRRGLEPLVRIADELGVAVLGITHFRKSSQGTDPTERIVGSLAYTAVARVVMVAAKPDDPTEPRVLAKAKANIAATDGGLQFGLEQVDFTDGITAQRVVWGAAVDGSARSLLGQMETDAEQGAGKLAEAVEWLRGSLATPCRAVDIEANARAAGITKATLRRAKKKLGAVSRQDGLSAPWLWSLPSANAGDEAG